MTKDEVVGWHHRFNGHEFLQTLGDNEGQGSLVCCRPWSCKESDTAEQLNNNKKKTICLPKTVLQVFWIQFLRHCPNIFLSCLQSYLV